MSKELEHLAENLADTVNGRGNIKMEQIIKLLSTDRGKRVLASLLSDGGTRIKTAAEAAKKGNLTGVQSIISSIAETEEGKSLLNELMNSSGK